MKVYSNKKQSVTNKVSQNKRGGAAFQFVDNRTVANSQIKLQEMANNSNRTTQLQAMANISIDRDLPCQFVNWKGLKHTGAALAGVTLAGMGVAGLLSEDDEQREGGNLTTNFGGITAGLALAYNQGKKALIDFGLLPEELEEQEDVVPAAQEDAVPLIPITPEEEIVVPSDVSDDESNSGLRIHYAV